MIRIKNLTKYILGEHLFEKVSFGLHKNDKVGLVGPNGSGKSTLLKIMLGQVEPDSGTVHIENERIGSVSQELAFQPTDTIQIFLSQSNHLKIQSHLKTVGLDKIPLDTLVQKLSGGQKTRLALAKVLLQNPTVLLLDEPTNHLDTKGLEWLEQFIREYPGAVIVISHDRTLLDHAVQRILEIDSTNHTFVEFQGGYTEYISQRKQRLVQNKRSQPHRW